MKKIWKKFCLCFVCVATLCMAFVFGGCDKIVRKEVYYVSQMRFYVNPENPTMSEDGSSLNTSGSEYGVYGAYGEHVLDNMIKLLNGDAFAEEMLLRSQDTSNLSEEEKEIYKYLPMKDVWTNETEVDLAEELNIEIDEAIYYVQAVLIAENDLKEAQEEYLSAVQVYRDKLLALKSEWNRVFLTTYGEYSEEKYESLTTTDKQHEHFYYVEEAYLANRSASEVLKTGADKAATAMEVLRNAERNAQTPRNEVFRLWEQTAKYQKDIKRFGSAVQFSFLLSNEDIEGANKFARSFIYVNISVKGEENYNFACELYDILKDLVPEYVEASMAIPQGYMGTNCQRISRDDKPIRIEK